MGRKRRRASWLDNSRKPRGVKGSAEMDRRLINGLRENPGWHTVRECLRLTDCFAGDDVHISLQRLFDEGKLEQENRVDSVHYASVVGHKVYRHPES